MWYVRRGRLPASPSDAGFARRWPLRRSPALQNSLPDTPSPSGLAHAFGITFAWVLGLTVLSFVPALLFTGRPTRQSH